LLFLTVLLPAPRSAGAQETCTSAQCHATLVAGADVHPATEDCESCHEATAEPHPQPGKKTFALSAEPPELCWNCHDAFGTKAQVHDPVAGGECTTCHDPHSSNQAKLLAAPVGELCTTCHDDVASSAHLHGPVSAGECTACHTPHESDAKPLLVKPADKLCFDCHGEIEQVLAKNDVHPAIEEGCTACHSPHGSDQRKLLTEATPQLCFGCHDDVATTLQDSKTVHAAAESGKQCFNCHSPHATDNKNLLLQPEQKTCLGCHTGLLTPSMTVLHQPVAAGRCTSCHSPHASNDPRLLLRAFPTGPYAPYTSETYELCLSCHNPDLARYPDTEFATNFRDGKRNLHYLHVNNPQKGRSCILCHGVHGASNQKLVADSVPFGQWNLPIKFVPTATGGSCSPGCHRPQSYDRGAPAAVIPVH